MLTVSGLRFMGLGPFDLELADGECIAVLGASGTGKSLLLRAIADLDPNEGDVRLDGASRETIPAPQWRRLVGYLATDAGWWHAQVGAHFTDWSTIEADLAALGLPAACREWTVARLSTGERQRLAFLRLLANRPRILLLDEPTSGLDAAVTATFEALAERERRAGRGILWVTHDSQQAGRVATRRFTLAGGALRAA